MLPLNIRDNLLSNTKEEDVYDTVAEKVFKMVDDSKFCELSDT